MSEKDSILNQQAALQTVQTAMLHAQQEAPALISSLRVTPEGVPFGPMPKPAEPLPPTPTRRLLNWVRAIPGKVEARIRAAAYAPSVYCNIALILLFQYTLWIKQGNGFIVTCPYLPDGLAVFAPSLLLLPVYLMIFFSLRRLQAFRSALGLYALSAWVLIQVGTAYRNFWQKVDVLLDICSFKVLRHLTEEQAFEYLRQLPESHLLPVDILKGYAKAAHNYKNLDLLFNDGLAAKKLELLAKAAEAAARAKQLAVESIISDPTYWEAVYGALTGPTACSIYAGVSWCALAFLLGLAVSSACHPSRPPAPSDLFSGPDPVPLSMRRRAPLNFNEDIYLCRGPGHKYVVDAGPGYKYHHHMMMKHPTKDTVVDMAIYVLDS